MQRNSRAVPDYRDFSFMRGALVACGLSALVWSGVWFLI
jgi:hypothetical protein